MKLDALELTQLAAAQAAPRMDIYAGIHKALRAMMADALLAVGRLDTDDEVELGAVSERVSGLLDACAAHLRHENDFVHVAMEARAPGASEVAAHEHEAHGQAIDALREQLAALCGQPAAQRGALALHLYRQLALFVAHNFTHMHVEETAHNAVLWSRYTDAQLGELHDALLASIPPHEQMRDLQWMLRFMSPAERHALLAELRAKAPAPVFDAVLDLVRNHLTPVEWGKLMRSLGLELPQAAVLTAAWRRPEVV